jgi:hypothetical protein
VGPGLEALARYADLNIELDARLETRLERLRNLNCTAADISNAASGCEGGFLPALDQQFRLRAGGVISDRLHVNVDFDSQREFSTNNRINVWYQGLPASDVAVHHVGHSAELLRRAGGSPARPPRIQNDLGAAEGVLGAGPGVHSG